MKSRYYLLMSLVCLLVMISSPVLAAEQYPPTLPQPEPNIERPSIVEANKLGIIFTNTHNYGSIEIKVELFDNYLGDTSKYHWVYTVTNITYDPSPGSSNGFSGFELALTQFVPDLADQDGANASWTFNGYSGQPVEWDIPESDGLGVMPGEVGVFSFTTLPRFVTISEGWYHTWVNGFQEDIVNYPAGEGPESPDLEDITPPELEFCCFFDAAGAASCLPVPVGECEAQLDGTVVPTCDDCESSVATDKERWGSLKAKFN